MGRDRQAEEKAVQAAQYLRDTLGCSGVRTALVLGTGWGDAVSFDRISQVSFETVPGFERLRPLEGHARRVEYGLMGGEPVLVLRGRVHLNETIVGGFTYPNVRLQIEMLLQLGVGRLILTCAAGSLDNRAAIGDVVIIDGFVTVFAPPMPLYGGEFVSPEDTLDHRLQGLAYRCAEGTLDDDAVEIGGHVMVRGPFFEGRRYDKPLLAQTGATVVGMSVLPEACVAALYPGTRVLALAFVTNDDQEEHSHETNRERAQEAAGRLGGYLDRIIAGIRTG